MLDTDPSRPDERTRDQVDGGASPRILFSTTNMWASDFGLIRALRRAGIAVAMLAPAGHPADRTRMAASFTQNRLRPRAGLLHAVDAFAPDLLVPGDERARRVMHELHATGSTRDRALVERSLGDPAGYDTILSRGPAMDAAQRAGIPVPALATDLSQRGLADFLAGSPTGAIVLKMDGTWAGDGVRVVRTPAELDAARDVFCRRRLLRGIKRVLRSGDANMLIDRVHGLRPALSAQHFLPGRLGDVALFCRDGVALGATVAEREAGLGGLGPSTIVRVVERPALVEAAARLVRQLGLSGFIGLDFIVDPETDEARVIEINSRATALAAIRPATGDAPAVAASRTLDAADGIHDPHRPMVAYFPKAWEHHPNDTRLAWCAADIPTDEPELVQRLLAPPRTATPHTGRLRSTLAAARKFLPMPGHGRLQPNA